MAVIVTRQDGNSAKGTPLTNSEMDLNINNLNSYKLEVASVLQGNGLKLTPATQNDNGNIINNITLDVESLEYSFSNTTGSTINKGTPVFIKSDGTLDKALASNPAYMPAIGITAENISTGNSGIVIFRGFLDLDTSSYSVGNKLYVSSTGTLTTTKPANGTNIAIQHVATVVKSNVSGLIFVAINPSLTQSLDITDAVQFNSVNQQSFGVTDGGSVSAPPIKKIDDTDTGIYWPGTNQIAVTAGGVAVLSVDTGGNLNLSSTGKNTTILGNLIVQGDTTTLNTSTLEVEDLNIIVAKNATDSASANTGGLTINGAGVSFQWSNASSSMTLNKPLTLTGNLLNATNNTYDIGTSSVKWKDLYLSGNASLNTLSTTGNITIGDNEAVETHSIKGATTLLSNSAVPALKITQTGSGNALVVEDESSDSTPFVVSSGGVVGIGVSAPGSILTAGLVAQSSAAYLPQMVLINTTDDATAPYWSTRKTRNGGPVSSGDDLGTLVFQATDATSTVRNAGHMTCRVAAAPGSNYVPTKMLWYLTSTAGASVEALNLDTAQMAASGNIKTYGVFLAPDGTEAAPSIANSDHTGTGIYFGTNTLSVSTAGISRLTVNADGTVTNQGGTVGNLAILDESPAGSPTHAELGSAAYATLEQAQDQTSIGWRDLIADIVIRGLGTDPIYSQIGATPFYAYKFGIGKKCWVTFHINHDYKPGGAIHLHTHWTSSGTDTTNTVAWKFSYAVVKGHNQSSGGDIPTSATDVTVSAASGAQYRHMISETSASITVTNAEVDALLLVTVERVTNGGTDNTDDIFLLSVDCHYESNRHSTPNKAPNFYGET